MPELTITLNVDESPWSDLRPIKEIGSIERIGRIPKGMNSGASAVAIAVRAPDGTMSLAQTSLALLKQAIRAFEIREQEEARPKN